MIFEWLEADDVFCWLTGQQMAPLSTLDSIWQKELDICLFLVAQQIVTVLE